MAAWQTFDKGKSTVQDNMLLVEETEGSDGYFLISPKLYPKDFTLNYKCSKEKLQIIATTNQSIIETTSFVLPIVSPKGEKVAQFSENEITIEKPNGIVKVTANVPIKIKEIPKLRTFNMVPGVAAVPIVASFQKEKTHVRITIEII